MSVTTIVSHDSLNDLLIELGRSLLQYVGESWPWTSADEQETQRSITSLIDDQQQDVLALAERMNERHHSIDFGTYPTEYTSLHYVSLDYLLDELVLNQQAKVRACDELLMQSESGEQPEVAALLQETTSREQRILAELRHLARARSEVPPSGSVSRL